MNVTLKDDNGEETKEVPESITISPEPTQSAPAAIQELTSEVKHLRDEIIELKQQAATDIKTQEEPVKAKAPPPTNTYPQQLPPTTSEEKSTPSELSRNSKSFLDTLFRVLGAFIMFISRGLFFIFNILFSFVKSILDMLLDILIAVDFTGILADLTDRKDKV